MQYPQYFIDRVKKAYPDRNDIHEALENGDNFSLPLLLTNRSVYGENPEFCMRTGISLDEIISATSLEDLQSWAKEIKEKCEIYHLHCRISNGPI